MTYGDDTRIRFSPQCNYQWSPPLRCPTAMHHGDVVGSGIRFIVLFKAPYTTQYDNMLNIIFTNEIVFNYSLRPNPLMDAITHPIDNTSDRRSSLTDIRTVSSSAKMQPRNRFKGKISTSILWMWEILLSFQISTRVSCLSG